MGSIDSAFGGNNNDDGGFEPDDFYESFLAPKFHDFTAPEEPIDPDAYFLSKPGMLKKAFAVEEVKNVAPKIQKVDAPVTQHQLVPPKSPVAVAEKTVRVGSAKKINALASPLTSKSLKNGSVNSPSQQQQLPMLEKSLKPTSLAKKLQASENDDPNSPTDVVVAVPLVKAVKPALTRQRSQKVQEEKPSLTRQRSQKLTVDSSESDSSNSQDKGTPLKKEAVSNGGAPKVKTPVKTTTEAISKCTEVAESPAYSGHHCKHARCAANDPHYASPVPTKKYLVAKKGTPGSIRKTTPAQRSNEDVSSEVSSDESVVVVAPRSQVALEKAFDKLALEQEPQQVTKDLKEVSDKASLTSENIRDWSRNSVNCEENAAPAPALNVQEKAVPNVEEKAVPTVESGAAKRDSKVELFLQVASDCLENIDLNKLEVPPTKVVGKKRKSGELLPVGASKKPNCASGENTKAVAKKISQAKDSAASKTAKMKLRRLSVARRLSVVRSKPGVTNPRPFRLRTQERGAVKEKEFMKKLEEYKAAKEGFNSAFQGLAAVEPKIPGKFLKSGHVFAAKRADPKDEKEVTKPTIPVAQKAPLFDHPFKPHRSTKKLTVPQEPKFHTVRGSRTCPSSHVGVAPSA